MFTSALILALVHVVAEVAIAEQPTAASAGKNSQKSTDVKKLWSGDLGVDFVSSFFAFGALQENKGAIAQPYLGISRSLFQSDGLVSEMTLGLQLWSSLHSEKTGAGANSSAPAWYEFDYFVPLGVTLAKRFTVTATYFEFYSPNGAFSPVRSVQTEAAYDDSDLIGVFALHPHVTVLYNFQGVLSIDRSDAWYYEIGISPDFTLNKKNTYPITFKFPITFGLGDDHFYPSDPYGFFSTAINASVPLPFLPKSFGGWTINAGFTYLNLGEAAASVNSHGRHNAYVGQIGMALTF